MAYFLQSLIPTTGLIAWYPLDNDQVGGFGILDGSGAGRDLATGLGLDPAPVTADQINGRNAVVGDGTSYNDAWTWTGGITLKDAFIIAKVDDTLAFPATFRGLFTGILTGTFPVLVGKTSSTRWISNAEGSASYDYYKSGTAYANTAREAPFDYFEQMRVKSSGGFSLDGINLNRDREDTARQFNGKWCDAIFYNTVLSDAQVASLKLYGDLKFNLWLDNGTTLTYPDPDITGITWRHFKKRPGFEARAAVTDHYTFEDEGRTSNRRTDTPPERWDIDYTGLSFAQMEIFDIFSDAVGDDRTFSFVDKWGVSWTGVTLESYSSSHGEHKSWDNTVSLTLVKYPS